MPDSQGLQHHLSTEHTPPVDGARSSRRWSTFLTLKGDVFPSVGQSTAGLRHYHLRRFAPQMLRYQRAFAPTPTPDLRCPEKGHGLTFSQSSSVSFRPVRGLEGAGGPDSLALDGKTCATTAEQLPEYCATIVLQLPSKDLSAYAYFVTALDTSARMYKTKKE